VSEEVAAALISGLVLVVVVVALVIKTIIP
jgi:hypothetical protein